MIRKDISRLREYRTTYFLVGLAVSLALMNVLMSWTIYDVQEEQYVVEKIEKEEEVEIVRTPSQKKKKLPPVKLPEVNDVIEPEEPEFTEELIPEDAPISEEAIEQPEIQERKEIKKVELVEPPPEIIDEGPEFWTRVEHMPQFGDCSNCQDEIAKRKCSDTNLLTYVKSRIKYPTLAREIGLEGTVVVRFMVNTDGSITDFTILRDIGGGCGKEVERIVTKMPNWKPGVQGGNKVKVQFTLPVKFNLQ